MKSCKGNKCILPKINACHQYEKATCYMTPTIWHPREGKAIGTVKAVSSGWEEKGEWTGGTRGIQGSRIIPYDTVMVDTLDIHLSKPMEPYKHTEQTLM